MSAYLSGMTGMVGMVGMVAIFFATRPLRTLLSAAAAAQRNATPDH
jgi:hypothetical protein